MNKTLQIIIKLILSYGITISIASVTGFGITGIDIMLPFVFICAYIITGRVFDGIFLKRDIVPNDNTRTYKYSVRDIVWAVVPGFIFAVSVVLGAHFDVWNEVITDFGIKDIVYFVFLLIIFSALILLFFDFVDKKGFSTKKDGAKNAEDKESCGKLCSLSFAQKHILITLLYLLCWFPYYLTLFPGNLGKDTFESVDMCLGNIPWTNHHPIFFTTLINIVIKSTSFLGNITASIGIFTFIHMLLVALTLGYVTIYLIDDDKTKKILNGKTWFALSLVFFGLNPVVAMFSMYISKDVLFSCAVAMLVLKLCDVLEKPCVLKDYIYLGIWVLLTLLLRNNGILMIVGLLFAVAIVYRKKGKWLVASLLIPLLIFFIFKTSAYRVLNVAPESFAEAASVPLQQVGYVISESQGRSFSGLEEELLSDNKKNIEPIKGLSEADMDFLERLMPFEEVERVYTLGYTDPYKFDKAFDDEFLNKNKGEFIKIWFKMLPAHFGDYVKAYLAQTAGYWHYGETNTLCSQGVWEDNELGVTRIDAIEKMLGFSLYGIIEKLMLFMRKAPIICIFTSMAMQFYGILLLIAMYIRKAFGAKKIIPLVPLAFLWLGIMLASPAFCLFRYTYPMYILWLVIIKEMILTGVSKD